MSVLEFISSLKWPVVLLAVLGWIAHTLRKPAVTDWLKEWLSTRNFRARFATGEIETTSVAAAVQAATATDEQLGQQEEPQRLRQEAAEQLMRQAAMWGWRAHRAGMEIPVPQVEMRGDQPIITFANSLELLTPAQQQSNLLQTWYLQHLRGE